MIKTNNIGISKMKSNLVLYRFPKDWEIGGIKYKKSTIRNQSIIQKYISSPMGPQQGKMKKKHVFQNQ
jgi:hypothetical protein